MMDTEELESYLVDLSREQLDAAYQTINEIAENAIKTIVIE